MQTSLSHKVKKTLALLGSGDIAGIYARAKMLAHSRSEIYRARVRAYFTARSADMTFDFIFSRMHGCGGSSMAILLLLKGVRKISVPLNPYGYFRSTHALSGETSCLLLDYYNPSTFMKEAFTHLTHKAPLLMLFRDPVGQFKCGINWGVYFSETYANTDGCYSIRLMDIIEELDSASVDEADASALGELASYLGENRGSLDSIELLDRVKSFLDTCKKSTRHLIMREYIEYIAAPNEVFGIHAAQTSPIGYIPQCISKKLCVFTHELGGGRIASTMDKICEFIGYDASRYVLDPDDAHAYGAPWAGYFPFVIEYKGTRYIVALRSAVRRLEDDSYEIYAGYLREKDFYNKPFAKVGSIDTAKYEVYDADNRYLDIFVEKRAGADTKKLGVEEKSYIYIYAEAKRQGDTSPKKQGTSKRGGCDRLSAA